VNHLPKFHLNRTVNELENAVLQKLHKPEMKSLVPGGIKPTHGGSYCTKITKNNVFAQYSHRLKESSLLPGDSSQKNPELG